MSNSERLSQTAASIGGGKGIFGPDALVHEVGMKEAVRKLIPILQEEYPNLKFIWKKKITKRELVSKVKPKASYYSESESSFVSPDGGYPELLHRGISHRKFSRSWTLADDVVVNDAKMKDGMLTVHLERVVPDEKKPRKITIK